MASYMHELHSVVHARIWAGNAAIGQSDDVNAKRVSAQINSISASQQSGLMSSRRPAYCSLTEARTRHPSNIAIIFQLHTMFTQHHCISNYPR